MKLVTFQSNEALKDLFQKGYLECDKTKIDLSKVGMAYEWIVENMKKSINNDFQTCYPIWCWVKCYNGICPPKIKGTPVTGFDAKITFNKKEKEIFITDFRRYSFLLNNLYIPNSEKDKAEFDNKLKKYNITNHELKAYARRDKFKEYRDDEDFVNICNEIKESFDRCQTEDSNILQGCVWRIYLDEIEKIEILKQDGYVYGFLNYVRSAGKRFDWIADYYKNIK